MLESLNEDKKQKENEAILNAKKLIKRIKQRCGETLGDDLNFDIQVWLIENE